MNRRPAVFLDRDGTLIEDPGYLRDPDAVRVFPGAGAAIARLNTADVPVIVVSNQSGIARGLLTELDYERVQRRMKDLLAVDGARLDAEYFCPHLPAITGPCECRKPGVLLYRQAAERLGLDLTASWWIGDRLRDVIPAETFGGQGILVHMGAGTSEAAGAAAGRFLIEPGLPEAVSRILDRLPRPGAPDYFPAP